MLILFPFGVEGSYLNLTSIKKFDWDKGIWKLNGLLFRSFIFCFSIIKRNMDAF